MLPISRLDLYFGIDLSTQSCKGVVIAENLQTVSSAVVHFDSDLPHYQTKNGVLLKGNGVVVSPTLMIGVIVPFSCLVGRGRGSAFFPHEGTGSCLRECDCAC